MFLAVASQWVLVFQNHERCWKAENSGPNAVQLIFLFLQNDWIHSRNKKNFNVLLSFAYCYKLLYDMSTPDIENIVYSNVCKQPNVTAKLLHDLFRQTENMMRRLRSNVVVCFKDKSLKNPFITNKKKRMRGKNLRHSSAGLLLMKHSSPPHCYLVVDIQQLLNSAIKAERPKSKLRNNNIRLQKYAQCGWNTISSIYIKRCSQLTENEEALFVNPMDYILKLPDGYTTESYARQQKPLLPRHQNQNSSDSVLKMTAIASLKNAQKGKTIQLVRIKLG